MGDRLDALERLARLRNQGALTEVEFSAEKVRLLADPAAPLMSSTVESAVEAPRVTTGPSLPNDQSIAGETPGALRFWPVAAGGAAALTALVAGAVWFGRSDVLPSRPAATASAQAALPTPTPTASASWQDLTPKQAQREAFIAAFGHPPLPAPRDDVDASSTKPVALIHVGAHQALVTVTENLGAAHVESGTLEVRYVDVTATGYQRAGAAPAEVKLGSFGQIGGWKLRRDLGVNAMIVGEGGGTWQGCTGDWTSLIELTPSGPIVAADGIPTAYDDQSGTSDGGNFDGKLQRDGNGISVRYTGSVAKTIRFARRGGKLIATESLPSIC